MTGSLAGLLFANALYLAMGIALLPLLRIVRTREQLVSRLGLAYVLGVAAAGVLSAHLALIRVPVGLVELFAIALVLGIAAWRRIRNLSPERAAPRPRTGAWLAVASRAVGVASFVLALVLIA